MTALEAAAQMIAEGVIEVRPDGTIWKLRNKNAMPLAAPRRLETLSKRGYLMVRLYVDGKPYLMAAHRLVWTHVRGPIPAGLDLNHKDGNRTNNHPDNLEPATRSENHLHAYRVLGRKLSKTTPRPILAAVSGQAKALRAAGKSYAAIAQALGVSQTTAFRATRL